MNSSYQLLCIQCSYITLKERWQIECRTKLVSQIIEKFVKDTENNRCGGSPSTADNPFRLIKQHFPSYIPATEKK